MDIEEIFQLVRLHKQNASDEINQLDDINIINSEGQNLLQEAIAYSNKEVISLLIKLGIYLNHQDKRGTTAIHFTCMHKDIETLKDILQNGADVNIEDNYGNQAMWTATFNARGEYSIVKLIKKFGANANHKNKTGRSPLDFAKQLNDEELISILSNGI